MESLQSRSRAIFFFLAVPTLSRFIQVGRDSRERVVQQLVPLLSLSTSLSMTLENARVLVG